jgi:hypothetical protein
MNESDHGTVHHQQAPKKLIDFAESHKQGYNLIVFRDEERMNRMI